MSALQPERPKIAVIGTGISGLSAAWLLQQTCDVTVFEQASRIGGHSHTVEAAHNGGTTPVDMGFIVYNEFTYPNLVALFDHLGVATQSTNMSFGVSLDDGRLEYAGGYLNQLVAQKRNIARPRFWAMVWDLVRFYRNAAADLKELERQDMTLGAYLESRGYGRAFREDHLLPMAAAIWSMPASAVLDYPAHAFIRFYENHGLLKLTDRPLWRTVVGGSREYVKKLTAPFADRIHTDAGIVSIERRPDGVYLRTRCGERLRFHQVVIATHADQALALLEKPTTDERAVLGAFQYSSNEVVLHSDESFMPKRRRAWASWNYIGSSDMGSASGLTVTYWMNLLQSLPAHPQLFVTLNPAQPIAPDKVHQRLHFEHPLFDAAAMRAQRDLWSLQGRDCVWYCGAHFGAGFHEDGLQSGLAVAEAIGGKKRPWQVANQSGRIYIEPTEIETIREGVAA